MEIKRTPIPLLSFTEEQENSIRRMAALSYSHADMAQYLEIPYAAFYANIMISDSRLNYLINDGVLVSKVTPETKLFELAESGNLTAIQQLEKLHSRKFHEKIYKELDEDEL